MKNKFLIIPKDIEMTKESNETFLFPLKGFSIGHTFEASWEEIKSEAMILINRLLDKKAVDTLEEELKTNSQKIKGIVFEDLGVLEIVRNLNLSIETIYYPTHSMCSIHTVNACLDYVDSVVLSPDITELEIKAILLEAQKEVCLYTYGPLPYLYSRRTLLKNFQKIKGRKEKKVEIVTEKITDKQFLFVEQEFGTVCYDRKNYDGRRLLKEKNVKYHILNFEMTENEREVLKNFETINLEQTTFGFLDQKTIYRLPPKGE